MLDIDFNDLNKIIKDRYGRVSGLFAINKPQWVTSHDIVDQVRKKLNTKKVGHAGALDPFATGLLLILIGKYTKKSDMLLNLDKSYRCRILIGVETDSLDVESKMKSETVLKDLDLKVIQNKINELNKDYNQYVPIYSSVKVNGMKLRELVRTADRFEVIDEDNSQRKIKFILNSDKGKFQDKADNNIILVNLPQKKVEVEIKILGSGLLSKSEIKKSGIEVEFDHFYLDLEVDASKGTYIRQLAIDLTEPLNTKGILISLERIKLGPVSLKDSVTVDEMIIE